MPCYSFVKLYENSRLKIFVKDEDKKLKGERIEKCSDNLLFDEFYIYFIEKTKN